MKNQVKQFILVKEKAKTHWTIEIVQAIKVVRTKRVKRVKKEPSAKQINQFNDLLNLSLQVKEAALVENRRVKEAREEVLKQIQSIQEETKEVIKETEEILGELKEVRGLVDIHLPKGKDENEGGSEGNSEDFGSEESSGSTGGEAVEAKSEESKKEVPHKRKSQILYEEHGWKMGKLEGLVNYSIDALKMLNLEYPELPVLQDLRNMVDFFVAFVEKRRTIKTMMNKVSGMVGKSWQYKLEEMGKNLVGALKFLVDNAGNSEKVKKAENWIKENLKENVFFNLDLNLISRSQYLETFIQKRR